MPDSTLLRNKMSDTVTPTQILASNRNEIGCQTNNTVLKGWDWLLTEDKACQTSRIKIDRSQITRHKITRIKTSHPTTSPPKTNHQSVKRTKNDKINHGIAEWYETQLEIERLADINNNPLKKVECEIKNYHDAENEKLRQDSLNKYSRIIEIQSNKIDTITEDNRKLTFEMDELKAELNKIKQLYAFKSAGEQSLQIECNSYKIELDELKNAEKKLTCSAVQTEERKTKDFETQTEVIEGSVQVKTRIPRVLIQTRIQTRSPSRNSPSKNSPPKNSPSKKYVHFSNKQTFETQKRPHACDSCVSLKMCEIKLSRAEDDLVEAQAYGKKMVLANLELKKLNEETKIISKEASSLSSEFSNF